MTAGADLIVAGARFALTMDSSRRVLEDAAIAISGGEIVEIGSTGAIRSEWERGETQLLDASECLVTPGLVNAHTHLESCFDKGLMGGVPVGPFVERYFSFTYGGLNAETYKLACLTNMIACLKTGTTTVADCGTVPTLEHVAVGAVEEVGMRAVLARSLMDGLEPGEPFAETTDECLERGQEFLASGASDTSRVSRALALHALNVCSPELCRGAASLSERYAGGLHSHVAYSHDTVELTRRTFGRRDVDYLAGLDVLGPRFVAAHAVWTTARELIALRDSGSHVVHVPGSQFFAQGAVSSQSRFPDYLNAGINVALGNDESSTGTTHDLVRDMYMASVGHAEAQQPRTYPDRDLMMPGPGDESPPALEAATVNGAHALGLAGEIGSLEVGKRADLVVWDLTSYEWTPTVRETLVNNFIYNGTGRSARDVVCDGRIVMRDRRVALVDEDAIRVRVQELAERITPTAPWLRAPGRWTLMWSEEPSNKE